MAFTFGLSTRDIRDLFTQEITRAGGTVSDTFDDEKHLFLRAILPDVREVRPRDQMQGGVALRATDQEIRVHPYLFRQVCRNGAIVVHAIETRQIELADLPTLNVPEVLVELREAVRDCCSPEVFARGVEGMRTASEREADVALQLLPVLSRLPRGYSTQLLTEIMSRFTSERDRSAFGLVNAVTSVARDTSDPEMRWNLEELGGGIPALVKPSPTLDSEGLEEMLVELVGATSSGHREEARTYRRA
jgi:hypothetical protein